MILKILKQIKEQLNKFLGVIDNILYLISEIRALNLIKVQNFNFNFSEGRAFYYEGNKLTIKSILTFIRLQNVYLAAISRSPSTLFITEIS